MKNKYFRYALGIPVFCIGVGIWITEVDPNMGVWYLISRAFQGVIFLWAGLELLDVPTITIINHINKKEE